MCISRHVAHELKRPACGTLRVNSCEKEEERRERERKRRSASACMRAFKPASVPSSPELGDYSVSLHSNYSGNRVITLSILTHY